MSVPLSGRVPPDDSSVQDQSKYLQLTIRKPMYNK